MTVPGLRVPSVPEQTLNVPLFHEKRRTTLLACLNESIVTFAAPFPLLMARIVISSFSLTVSPVLLLFTS
jgi:hypothetical protein